MLPNGQETELAEYMQCSACTRHLPPPCFADASTLCLACAQKASFEVYVCGACGRVSRRHDCDTVLGADGQRLCAACVKQCGVTTCTVCKQKKPISSMTSKKQIGSVHRCIACSSTCKGCGKEITDSRSFATNSAFCWACHRERKPKPKPRQPKPKTEPKLRCSACGTGIPNGSAPHVNPLCHGCSKGRIICQGCNEPVKGKEIRLIKGSRLCRTCIKAMDTCSSCGTVIPKQVVSHGKPQCNDCSKKRILCQGCHEPVSRNEVGIVAGLRLCRACVKTYGRDTQRKKESPMYTCKSCGAFVQKQLMPKGKLQCGECMARGRRETPPTVTCSTCGISMPKRFPFQERPQCHACQAKLVTCHQCHKSVDRSETKNFSRRLLCLICVEQNARDKEREKRLLHLLRQPKAWRCKCRKIARNRKAYAALYEQYHKETCYLFGRRMDGGNLGITADDMRFLASRNAY